MTLFGNRVIAGVISKGEVCNVTIAFHKGTPFEKMMHTGRTSYKNEHRDWGGVVENTDTKACQKPLEAWRGKEKNLP